MLYVGQNKYTHRSWRYIGGSKTVMGNLHDDVILLIRPESFGVALLYKQERLLSLKTHLNMKGKTKRSLVVVVKCPHRANGLLTL